MKIIILMALPEEAPSLAARSDVIISGVGKINAAAATAFAIAEHSPELIVNFGTAGSVGVGTGLHRASRFVQRDMRCESLGVPAGVTPYDHEGGMIVTGENGVICSTGDNFVTGADLDIAADIVDMEAYAIAKICHQRGVRFQCWKYVTDFADAEAAAAWQQNRAAGETWYLERLQALGV